MRRMIQSATACLLVLASLTLTPLAAPETALAADATVTECTEASFDAALAAVQASGEGTIAFACSGTITFTSQKTISSIVRIVSDGSVTFDGGGSVRLFQVNSGARLELTNLTLQNAHNGDQGGAIHNTGRLVVVRVTFSDNRSIGGGAIVNLSGSVTITASTFTNNRADSNGVGGAISQVFGNMTIHASTFVGNTATNSGGAIQSAGDMTISSSTFVDNHAGIDGGAIFISHSLTIRSSTFYQNVAADSGGAISGSHGPVRITGSTLYGNVASSRTGGGVHAELNSIARIEGSIIAGNTAAAGGDNCDAQFGGTIASLGSNLSNDSSCALNSPGDIPDSANVNLGVLADIGGPTQTILPHPMSDAINAASCGNSTPVDQRGAPRPFGLACDIGAVELGPAVPVQMLAVYSSSAGINEGEQAMMRAIVTGPRGAAFTFRFDCDNDGVFETPGTASGELGTASCTIADVLVMIGAQACDAGDPGNCGAGSGVARAANVAPAVASPATQPAPSDEGEQVTASAHFSDPGSLDTHSCTINWGDGTVTGGTVTAGDECVGGHTYADDGEYTVAIRVCDDNGGCDSNSSSHTVTNIAPAVDTPQVNPAPSDEGVSVTASASFSDPGVLDTHTCEIDWGDGTSGEGTVTEADGSGTCEGSHTYADDDDYSVTVEVCDDADDCGQNSTLHTVLNLPPVIHEISVASGALGDPVTVTVSATDPGVNDVLSYSFDCDGDELYEIGPQSENSTSCPGDATKLTLVIGVRVGDGDGGVTEDAVTLTFSQRYCADRYTSQLCLRPNGCAASERAVVLTSETPTTFCASRYTGELRHLANGCPASGWVSHLVPGAEPLATCANRYTAALRVTANGSCTTNERLHLIPAA